MTNLQLWKRDEFINRWVMPAAPWWKRLPIVRHVRAIAAKVAIERWYSYGPGSIGLRTGYDDWVVFGVWHGLERRCSAPTSELCCPKCGAQVDERFDCCEVHDSTGRNQ